MHTALLAGLLSFTARPLARPPQPLALAAPAVLHRCAHPVADFSSTKESKYKMDAKEGEVAEVPFEVRFSIGNVVTGSGAIFFAYSILSFLLNNGEPRAPRLRRPAAHTARGPPPAAARCARGSSTLRSSATASPGPHRAPRCRRSDAQVRATSCRRSGSSTPSPRSSAASLSSTPSCLRCLSTRALPRRRSAHGRRRRSRRRSSRTRPGALASPRRSAPHPPRLPRRPVRPRGLPAAPPRRAGSPTATRTWRILSRRSSSLRAAWARLPSCASAKR